MPTGRGDYPFGVSSERESGVLLTSAAGALLTCAVLVCTSVFGWRVIDDIGELPAGGANHSAGSGSEDRNDPSPTAAPGVGGTAAEITALLSQVRVLSERPQIPGYERDCGPSDGCVFGTDWTDATDAVDGHNGCDTRNDVLANALADVTFSERSPDCDVVGGTLIDPYTGTVMDYSTEGSEIHVDHLIPLAAAWDLGAASWPLERRVEFANDTAVELIAVQGTANMSKGDSTPASWLPPLKSYRCTYVVRYLKASVAYDLPITEADRTVIGHVAAKC